jgi:aminopeptidase N
VAHELAHQWWGDSVTPGDWDDVWLSEGFATYFHALFTEALGGPPALREHMARAAATVREANARKAGAVIDPAVVEPAAKLSAFAYQKGAFVLHMLRRKLGDESFFRGLRRYYRNHAGGTARTDDLRHALEGVAGRPLEVFFRQWLVRAGIPDLRLEWSWDGTGAVVDVEQVQPGEPYEIDLELAFPTGEAVFRRTVTLATARASFRLPLPARPDAVEVDPDGWLLHTASVRLRQ